MRVGILGGSFNPPHRGHLALARTVLDRGLADSVLLVPAATPPHKVLSGGVDAVSRLAMTELLAGEDSRLDVDGIELDREGVSYTVDTLRQLAAANPGAEYRLVIGSDMAKTFASWREYREILRRAPPLVAERPDFPFDDDNWEDEFIGMPPEDARVLAAGRFAMPPVDVSSTVVRRLFRDGAEDGELLRCLTAPVLAYAREHRLYLDDK